MIVISITSAECLVVLMSHSIICVAHTLTLSNGQLILGVCPSHSEELVGPDNGGGGVIAQLNAKFHVFLCGEAVDVFQAVPELSIQITKTIHVVCPVAIEVHGTIDSPLDDGPLASIILHVAMSIGLGGAEGSQGIAASSYLVGTSAGQRKYFFDLQVYTRQFKGKKSLE